MIEAREAVSFHSVPKRTVEHNRLKRFLMQNVAHTDQKTSPLGIFAEFPSTREKSEDQPTAKDRITQQRFKLLRRAAQLLPDERISECQVRLAPEHDSVHVMRNTESGDVFFRHLVRCESYSCPICAYWRSEQDRHELSVALAEAEKLGLFPILVTCTLRHHAGDDLTDLREAVNTAFDRTFSGRWYQDFKDQNMIVGKISSWEVTYGKNGWHPHKHVLFFSELELVGKWIDKLADELKTRWIEQLHKLGYDATWANGIDVRTAESDIAAYIAKHGREPMEKSWGVDSEIAKSPVKSARLDGLTPFELLAAADGQKEALERFTAILGWKDTNTIKIHAGLLFKEYFYAFKGRARIHWGSMRKILSVDDALEAFAAANPPSDIEPQIVACIARGDEWRKVHGGRSGIDRRAELITHARKASYTDLAAWFKKHGIEAAIMIPPDPEPQITIVQTTFLERQKNYA